MMVRIPLLLRRTDKPAKVTAFARQGPARELAFFGNSRSVGVLRLRWTWALARIPGGYYALTARYRMLAKRMVQLILTATSLLCVLGCKESEKSAKPDTALATAAVTAAAPDVAAEPPPAGCKASGDKPVELGKAKGEVFGFVSDSMYVYFTSWHTMSSRGDLGRIRKDGEGTRALTSLALEARGLVVDERDIFYTEGIRLVKRPKDEAGKPEVIAPKFSSQWIALDGTHVYGVPGDYGPYDRLVKMEKKGGINFEIDTATRPEVKLGPVGYSAIVVDAKGIYVTDSGNHKVLRFTFDRAKPKVLATGQPKAYALAADSENLYFTLADKGYLMLMAKAGGPVKKLATGLVPKSRIAADENGAIAVFAGAAANAPVDIAFVPRDGGERKKLATVLADYSVEAVAQDKDCVYWAARATGSGNITFFAAAR